MHVQSWSPLSTTLPKYRDVLANIGKKYNKSGAQVGLRWILQSGGSFCTQSKKKEHFKEDLEVFDFSLTDAEMEKLSILAPPRVLGWDLAGELWKVGRAMEGWDFESKRVLN